MLKMRWHIASVAGHWCDRFSFWLALNVRMLCLSIKTTLQCQHFSLWSSAACPYTSQAMSSQQILESKFYQDYPSC